MIGPSPEKLKSSGSGVASTPSLGWPSVPAPAPASSAMGAVAASGVGNGAAMLGGGGGAAARGATGAVADDAGVDKGAAGSSSPSEYRTGSAGARRCALGDSPSLAALGVVGAALAEAG
ncbi:hypothetical protein [Nocardia sp. bgisy118]|uniref:hypothetical protein n=1 Tax=Nocardia sp. bgisy118 TaxID=3413786 RepID=UPI003F4A431F